MNLLLIRPGEEMTIINLSWSRLKTTIWMKTWEICFSWIYSVMLWLKGQKNLAVKFLKAGTTQKANYTEMVCDNLI